MLGFLLSPVLLLHKFLNSLLAYNDSTQLTSLFCGTNRYDKNQCRLLSQPSKKSA